MSQEVVAAHQHILLSCLFGLHAPSNQNQEHSHHLKKTSLAWAFAPGSGNGHSFHEMLVDILEAFADPLKAPGKASDGGEGG